MKTLLIGINSKFSHTNLAIRSIKEYVKHKSNINPIIKEFTINQLTTDILRDIIFENPNVILFSVYIWNIEFTLKVIQEIKKILPQVFIGVGGPEVSYRAEEILQENKFIDCVISGEGEISTCELLINLNNNFILEKNEFNSFDFNIDGIYFRNKNFTSRNPIQNLDELFFAYPQLKNSEDDKTENQICQEEILDVNNRIFYYESYRGCPFRCSYCLSSIDKSVRNRSLEKVFEDLKIFLDAKVKLVKFVDRTFNLNEDRTIAIWNFIKENHNGITMFHFEIAAQQLSEKMLQMIKDFPKGIMQFEIGIQSTNEKTLQAIGRPANLQQLIEKIKQIPKTIHSHLDLIAGLPHESICEFKNSFDFVIKLKPDMLQLGFLKILSGTQMETFAKENDYQFSATPPYEVLSTPYISYFDLQFLKDVEEVLDIFYNSNNFEFTFNYIFYLQDKFDFSIFEILSSIVNYFREINIFETPQKTNVFYKLFLDYINSTHFEKFQNIFNKELLQNLVKFDFIISEKTSNLPTWYNRNYNKENHKEALIKFCNFESTRLAYSHSEYDEFDFNPITFEKEKTKVLFVYDSVKGKTHTKQFYFLDKNLS
ncbi:MAG: DUF4080 domain-containing protein [Treponemataceae bacterium]|nr:DUF4080 domain-containing protein [Treponemataceae bacterium]